MLGVECDEDGSVIVLCLISCDGLLCVYFGGCGVFVKLLSGFMNELFILYG